MQEDSAIPIAILLIGYNRLDLLTNNLVACSPIVNKSIKLYVSVDGLGMDCEDSLSAVRATELDSIRAKLNPNYSSFRIMEKNYGCDAHIPDAISWALQESLGVIVLEDDVAMSVESILEIRVKLLDEINLRRHFPVIGMSAISVATLQRNWWRTTNYFSAWGYALSAEFWECHKVIMKSFDQAESVDEFLSGVAPWSNFPNRKKRIWRERLTRGNYDYKIQATIFKRSMKVCAPVLRISDNIGHGLAGATHTRHLSPRYLKARVKDLKRVMRGELSSKWILNLLLLADSNTWAGDGLLTSRGRTIGIRSSFRRMITKGRDAW